MGFCLPGPVCCPLTWIIFGEDNDAPKCTSTINYPALIHRAATTGFVFVFFPLFAVTFTCCIAHLHRVNNLYGTPTSLTWTGLCLPMVSDWRCAVILSCSGVGWPFVFSAAQWQSPFPPSSTEFQFCFYKATFLFPGFYTPCLSCYFSPATTNDLSLYATAHTAPLQPTPSRLLCFFSLSLWFCWNEQ